VVHASNDGANLLDIPCQVVFCWFLFVKGNRVLAWTQNAELVVFRGLKTKFTVLVLPKSEDLAIKIESNSVESATTYLNDLLELFNFLRLV
jgi:hypothetical protein